MQGGRGLGDLPEVALPAATWAYGARTVPPGAGSPPGAVGTGQGSSVCSCPVSHLHPCPLSRCRGVIFAEECAVPSDSRGLQGLCYTREAETRARMQ